MIIYTFANVLPYFAMIYFHNISIYTSLYLNSGVQRGTKSFYHNRHLMIYYLVPSFLYCLYNNLSFMNLSQFDPTTYLLLMQSRLLMTGMVYQVSIWWFVTRCHHSYTILHTYISTMGNYNSVLPPNRNVRTWLLSSPAHKLVLF